jgi:mRNA interferase RelE/StbE
MTWRVRHTRVFYKELARIPEKTRKQIEAFAFNKSLEIDPFASGKVEKLAGYDQYYKVRFGQYRIGLRIDKAERIMEFRRVRPRQDIYQKFP